MTAKYEISSDQSQPIACIGKYSSCVKYLLLIKEEDFLSFKNLWIDYRVIPIFLFYNKRNTSKTEFYFIECTSTEDFHRIIESNELHNLKSYGFTSVVLNYPPYLSKKVELSNMLNQLSSLVKVIILTSDPNFPVAESQKIRVEDEII